MSLVICEDCVVTVVSKSTNNHSIHMNKKYMLRLKDLPIDGELVTWCTSNSEKLPCKGELLEMAIK